MKNIAIALLVFGYCAACSSGGGDDNGDRSDFGSDARGDMSQPAGAKRLFVTSTKYDGSAVLDACSASAAAAELGGVWVPWLSTTTLDAKARVKGTGPWRLLDGTTVFKNRAQLGTSPSVAISLDENGATIDPDDNTVFTATTNGGTLSGDTCSDWTVGDESSGIVVAGHSDSLESWTDAEELRCWSKAHVYCFEQ